MHAVTRFLFPAPAPRTVRGILGWWERRRPAYNLIVGVSGVTSIVGALALIALPPGGTFVGVPPWQGILGVGIAANLFYFLGPAVEIAVAKLWGEEVLPPGPVLYRMGLTFSVGLAFMPLMVAMIAWVARIVGLVS